MPNKFLRPGERPGFGRDLKKDLLKYLRIGVVVRVDNEAGILDVDWLDFFGGRTEIPLPAAYGSQRGTIRGMQEVGSHVVCGWFRQEQDIERPIIISFLELNTKNSHEYRLSRGKAPDSLTDINTIRQKIGWNSERAKRRKLYPGEIQIESTQGSEIFLDDNVYISNDRLSEIEITSADQAISSSSRQNYISTSASRTWNGMITRDPISDQETMQPTVFPNGRRVQIITESNNPFHLGGNALNEFRIETYEKTNGVLNVTGVNSGYDITPLSPFISFVMGTLVGNDKSNVQQYSKVLRPQVFGTPDEFTPTIDEIECLPEEYNSLAGAFQLKFHDSGSRIDIDKQGHLFTHFAASTGQHPLGEGRSWEGNFDGSIKLVVGKNVTRGQSIILDTLGGVKETLGFDRILQRSKETIARKGIYVEVLGPDEDGNSYYIKSSGDTRHEVDGSVNISATRNYNLNVGGKIDERVQGTKNVNVINDQNTFIGGANKEVIIKDQETKIGHKRDILISGINIPPLLPSDTADGLTITLGSRKELYTLGNLEQTLTLGNKETTLTAGNIEETIILGDNKTTVTTGNIEENITLGDNKNIVLTGDISESITTGNNDTSVSIGDITESIITGNNSESITTGNKDITITAGNYTVGITAGNVEIKTTAGTVDVNSQTNQVTVNGLLKITIKSGAKIDNVAPLVSLGQLPTKGNVVCGLPGVFTTVDPITGIPPIGSATITASI